MPKVVIDTSVFVSGMLTKNRTSNPAQIIDLWRRGAFTLVMAPLMLREVVAKFIELGIEDELIVDFVATTAKIALNIPGVYNTTKLDDVDASDNIFLAAAYESGADFVVSLDRKSLLPLKHFHGTQILTPELFMRLMIEGHANESEERTADGLENEDFRDVMRDLDTDFEKSGSADV